MITRREWLLASSAFAAALTMAPRSGFAQGAKTLKVGFGQKAISPNLINLLIGETLGYNATEGFKVQGMAWAATTTSRSRPTGATSMSASACPRPHCRSSPRVSGAVLSISTSIPIPIVGYRGQEGRRDQELY